jgi:hypothetical protein
MIRHFAWTLLFVAFTVQVGATAADARAGIVASEICDNCFDDNNNGDTDRADAMCIPPANGSLAGLSDADARKAALKCQKTIGKASAKYFATALKRIDKCVDLAFVCVQLKNGSNDCLFKAQRACENVPDTLDLDDRFRFEGAIDKACRDARGAKISLAQLLDDTGLGFHAEQSGLPSCDPSFFNVAVLTNCIHDRLLCSAVRAVQASVPRTHELLDLVVGANQFPCVTTPTGSDGGGLGLAPVAKAKAAVKCQAAVKKAGLKVATIGLKVGQGCADAAAACIQTADAPTRDACKTKNAPKCQAGITKLTSTSSDGPLPKLLGAVVKKCTSPDLTESDLEGATGLGFGSAVPRCAQLTFPPADPTTSIFECVGAQHLCEDAQMLERQVPRLRELATFFNITIPEGL